VKISSADDGVGVRLPLTVQAPGVAVQSHLPNRRKIVIGAVILAAGAGTATAASQAPKVKQPGKTVVGTSVTVVGTPGKSVTTGTTVTGAPGGSSVTSPPAKAGAGGSATATGTTGTTSAKGTTRRRPR